LKSLTMLWMEIADESAIRCCTSATRDCKTVSRRFKYEGISFLTITLPSFGKDFERSLDQGSVDRSLFQGFSWRAGLPRFLGGFLDLVFDRSSGVLLDEPNEDAILAIRQLTLMFGKVHLECSQERIDGAFDGFIQCEQEVRIADARRTKADLASFRRMSSMLFADVLTEVDWKVFDRTLLPKHGPGATADGLRGNAKYLQREWTVRLEEYFPFGEYALPNSSFWDVLDDVNFLEPGQERPVRVVAVPKTLKTPRIIAIEPTAMQYAQQAVRNGIEEALSKDKFLSSVIGFDNQEPNQFLARKGSITRALATLDLKEASDRVSNQLVREMLIYHPHLQGAVDACRSRKADVPGHGVIRLAKFASMGSALTFPIEAMVFTTLIFMGIEEELGTPLDRETIQRFRGKVRVFGDDLIIPVDMVPSVVRKLEHFGALVNTSKSFWTGRFRESCGKEYYDGADISIVRVREMLPTQRTDAIAVNSLVSLRNQLYWAGYWRTCEKLDVHLQALLRHYPVIETSSAMLGRESVLGYPPDTPIGGRYQRPLVKGWVVTAKLPINKIEGEAALLKCLLILERKHRESKPEEVPQRAFSQSLLSSVSVDDSEHLERSGRPRVVNIKLVKGSPY